MKKIKLLLPAIFCLAFICNGQKKAVTESGDEVILYENGTWKYTHEFSDADTNFIKTDSQYYNKSKNASFLLKAKNGNVGFWVDPKKWAFGKSALNPDADFEISRKGQSVSGIIISEATLVPLESFVEIALMNGRNSAPDLKIIEKDYRTVNGIKLLHLKMEGTQVGIKFIYSAYYYSDSTVSIQFLVATFASVTKALKTDIDELLNGIVVIKTDSTSNAINDPLSKNDSISQGSLSPYNNCKKFFPGKWQYAIDNQVIEVERTLEKTIEYMNNRKYRFEYINRWLDSCRYELIFVKTNKPNFKDLKVGESMEVEVLKIDKKEMKYSVLFRGIEIKGEMTKKY